MRFYYTVFPGSSVVKNPPTMQVAQEKRARTPGLGRSPGTGNGNTL